MTNANARALGLTLSGSGVTAAGGNCLLINAGCYDSVITISNTASLWSRTGGPQGAGQYDFYSVVEHETDEGLGTVDLCCGQIAGFDAPVDLYRYQSDGTRSLAFARITPVRLRTARMHVSPWTV